jgi:pSer/pThr/pTyr-binding forkhead associated (FHA) protein
LGNPQIDTDVKEDVKRLESRTYIIGREGHIYINDPTVSKQHAELQIVNGEVYLRDLESTNGTFLIKNNRLVPFHEGYVQLHQPIVLGNRQYTVRSLLEIAGAFSAQPSV